MMVKRKQVEQMYLTGGSRKRRKAGKRGGISTRKMAKGVILGRRQGHMILGSRDVGWCRDVGRCRRSNNRLGSRRLAELLPTLVGRMVLLAAVRTL